MTSRRDALCVLGSLGAMACGARAGAPAARSTADAPFRLQPLVDLVPAAGLLWLVDLRPVELIGDRAFAQALSTVIPDTSLDAFAERHGGVDLRGATELVVAGFPDTVLLLARLPFEPGRVERAFAARALFVEGRAFDRGVTRVWGTLGTVRTQLALLGHDTLAIEQGRFGPLRTAIYFALGKLSRAPSALRASPLNDLAARLGEAPARAFAPGPFEGEWGAAGGGLLRASTAVGAAVRMRTDGLDRDEGNRQGDAAGSHPAAPDLLAAQLILTGAWGRDAGAAAKRLEASFQVLADDALGRLTGLDRLPRQPVARVDPAALDFEVDLDPRVVARGLHAATEASIAELLAF